MKYTNLNITDNTHTFKYIVGYKDNNAIETDDVQYYKDNTNVFFYNEKFDNVTSNKNYWIKKEKPVSPGEYDPDYIPDVHKEDTIVLYFPRFSVETYSKKVLYVLTINTWINGKYVFLGSYLIDRQNAIANPDGPKKFLDDTYYENIEVKIVDVNDLIYSDDWQSFRVNVCDEPIGHSFEQLNNTGSNLNFTLTPVQEVGGTYVKMENYDCSQSAISLLDKTDLSAHLDFINENGNQKFVCTVKFNEVYEGNLANYLFETYFIDPSLLKINFDLFIKTKSDAYKFIEHTPEGLITTNTFEKEEFAFDGWNDYIEGMNANVVVIITREEDDFLVFSSNEIPITQEIFSYLIKNKWLSHVNLKNIFETEDMDKLKVYNLDAVNRIENVVYTIDRKEDPKANIINNVFVRVQPAGAITIHKGVNENIVLNLDAYKNKVDIFSIKIGENVFNEIGRTNSGIVFKIIGNKLENISASGQYYILSGEDLVTTGNYSVL